jgi:hypothetical protein
MLAMLGFSVQGVRAYYRQDFDIAREDWRSATTHILGQAQPGDAILFHTAQGRMPFEFYEGLANAPVRPDIVFPASGPRLTFRDFFGRPSLSLAEDLAPQRQRVWLVLSHHLGPSGPDQLSAALSTALAAHYSHSERSEFPGIEVWQFSR